MIPQPRYCQVAHLTLPHCALVTRAVLMREVRYRPRRHCGRPRRGSQKASSLSKLDARVPCAEDVSNPIVSISFACFATVKTVSQWIHVFQFVAYGSVPRVIDSILYQVHENGVEVIRLRDLARLLPVVILTITRVWCPGREGTGHLGDVFSR
ncbi:hypothetical protein DPSP01_012042 [Paraphaeosphaeria sporulosa]|uniref:Uncharacterized protein n=1 Tax=Paraphaeosphaeria sporulosa TaxID=1460663 RepID=A0A177CWH2_9PLEO|nr:uncharacterized protein CC84DRAFT_2488 [Paraphaeosphaeria sporulosa]OAG11242.1 hypothetical protein CC84DRAFT_2488 [Paraphaeosphaeria sporulosa]